MLCGRLATRKESLQALHHYVASVASRASTHRLSVAIGSQHMRSRGDATVNRPISKDRALQAANADDFGGLAEVQPDNAGGDSGRADSTAQSDGRESSQDAKVVRPALDINGESNTETLGTARRHRPLRSSPAALRRLAKRSLSVLPLTARRRGSVASDTRVLCNYSVDMETEYPPDSRSAPSRGRWLNEQFRLKKRCLR